MSDIWSAAIPEIAKQLDVVLSGWARRNERRAAKDVADLGFWPDGMIHELKIIANGKATPETFQKLKEKFESSDEPAKKLMRSLLDIRAKLVGHRDAEKIIRQINVIVLDEEYGKSVVREGIRDVIRNSSRDNIHNEAKIACNNIESLNAEITKLSRIVHDS
jgi:N-methylhydantoinase B/oxoprolinase/acetone carboxylase alpha subunit